MNGSNIKVSVIMPVYNAFDYLRPAMDSVLDQTLTELEVICIDDGSTDHSLDILKEYQERDARVRIVTENNAGPSTARNKGIVRARGEYIMFLDADDFFEPDLLSSLYELARERSLDIAICNYDIYNEKHAIFTPSKPEIHADVLAGGRVISKSEEPDYILQCSTGYIWNKLFRTEFIKTKELMFAPELFVFEDTYYTSATFSVAERIASIDKVLVHHRIYSEQSRPKLFKKYYTQVPIVHLRIKEFLTTHGLYVPLKRSYINLSAARCYAIYNILWHDAKGDFWDLLHHGAADSFGWFSLESREFYSSEVCEFCANVGLYTHDQYQKRAKRGKNVPVEKLSANKMKKRIKGRNTVDKILSFFKRKKKK
jgi:glycosyltransferase involved in cell wall biosynthesis